MSSPVSNTFEVIAYRERLVNLVERQMAANAVSDMVWRLEGDAAAQVTAKNVKGHTISLLALASEFNDPEAVNLLRRGSAVNGKLRGA